MLKAWVASRRRKERLPCSSDYYFGKNVRLFIPYAWLNSTYARSCGSASSSEVPTDTPR